MWVWSIPLSNYRPAFPAYWGVSAGAPGNSCAKLQGWNFWTRAGAEEKSSWELFGRNTVQYLGQRRILLLALPFIHKEQQRKSFCLCLSFSPPEPFAMDTCTPRHRAVFRGGKRMDLGSGGFNAHWMALWVLGPLDTKGWSWWANPSLSVWSVNEDLWGLSWNDGIQCRN
jgi:hypothetical protein